MDGQVHETVRLRLDIAYDGSDFAGWARQAGGLRTVQGVLEEALAVAAGRPHEPLRLLVAGRTDAGVHATGQVAHVDAPADRVGRLVGRGHDIGTLARRLTGMLAERGDVVVRRVVVAPEGFDARFGAVHRRYEYRIADALEARDPLERHRTHVHPTALDEGRMQEAVRPLIGLHDFAAYCRPREGGTTIRTLQRFGWRRDDRGVLVATVQADAFCHSMVRALVGAAVAVGSGRLAPARIGDLLTETARSSVYATAPAKGLTLVEVAYPPDALLRQQAHRARARREVTDPSALG